MSKRMTMGDFLGSPPTKPSTPSSTPLGNPRQQPTTNSSTATPLPYMVRATKKGGVPCAVESRKHHKVVVLSKIEGDGAALLSALQKALGTGGVRTGNSVIEVQGENHLEKIKAFLLKSGCVVGATKQSIAEAAGNQKNKKGKPNSEAASSVDSISTVPLSQKAIKAMKPTELKDQLAARQLSTQGNKKELLARLVEAAVLPKSP